MIVQDAIIYMRMEPSLKMSLPKTAIVPSAINYHQIRLYQIRVTKLPYRWHFTGSVGNVILKKKKALCFVVNVT